MKSILIIDDEVDLCALLKRVLIKENFHIDCAYSLSEAGPKISLADIVLLDNNLPDGTGLQYLHEHRPALMNRFVIMITADTSANMEERARNEGVAAFIQKPFSIGAVREVIRRAS